MYKIASIALTAALGVVGVAQSLPAEAHPFVGVGISIPAIAVVPSIVYEAGYYHPYYEHGRYWRHGFERDRYEHFHHGWDRR